MAGPIIQNKPSVHAPKAEGLPDAVLPDASNAEEKSETSEADAQAEVDAVAAEELAESESLTRDRPQTTSRANTRQRSDFQQEPNRPQPGKLPDQIGHKINTQAMMTRDRATAETQTPENQVQQQSEFRTPEQPRTLPDQPPAKMYKTVLGERFFRGPLRGSPLESKLQPQSTEQSSPQQQLQQTRQGVRREMGEPLNKNEVLQLFRLRHQADQKEDFRKVLKYEAAKAKEEMRTKVQGNKFQTEAHHKKNEIDITQKNKLDNVKDRILHRLQTSASESKFEKTLQKIMNGEKIVPDLPEGTRASFNTKSEEEWTEFFKNTKLLGSELVRSKAELTKLIEALFRGAVKNAANKSTLIITDLAFSENGEVSENKFSQLEISDQESLELLSKLKPGDTIPQRILEKLGSEIDFMKLAHLVATFAMTEEQQKETLKFFKQQHSAESQRKFEQSLIDKRDQDEKDKDESKLPFEYAGVQHKQVEQFKGPPRLFMYMFYALGAIALMFIVFFILRATGLL